MNALINCLPMAPWTPDTKDSDEGFGCLRSAGGPLPLRAMTAAITAGGPVYAWKLRQEFVNPHAEAIEAVYIFPLPPRAAVTAFRMIVGDRIVEGVLQERGAARAAYATAIQQGKRAALLEEDRPDVFTVQVGNLPAGSTAAVELELSGPVAVENGIAAVRLPLVVAPRYIPGLALGEDVGAGTAVDTDLVPDASRISPPVLLPGFRSAVRLAITIAINGVPAQDLACTLPTTSDGVNRWKVVPGQRLDRDCILRWSARGSDLQATALAAVRDDGACTLAVTVIPPAPVASHRPRDVVVLIDRSGSMSGWKLIAARRAAARLVDSLDAQDRFAALAFDDVVIAYGNGQLAAATDRARFAAATWLGAIETNGGTEMDRAFEAAFKLLKKTDDGRDRVLVLVTDAQVGNEDQLLKRHARSLKDTRIVALGIDSAVNEGLLNRLVAPGGGWQACVESEDWLDQVLSLACRAVQSPALADISVTVDGRPLAEATPEPIPDAYAARPLAIWSRQKTQPRQVTVRGLRSDGTTWETTVPVAVIAEPALHAAWARGRIRDLEDRYAVTSAQETSDQITALSIRERVLSRFTAFAAIDHVVVNEGGSPRTIVQPVELPAGWDQADAEMLEERGSSYGSSLAGGMSMVAPPAQRPAPAPVRASRSQSGGGGTSAPSGKVASSRKRGIVAAPSNFLDRDLRQEDASDLNAVVVTVDPGEVATRLLAELTPVGADPMRRALALRKQSTLALLNELVTALNQSGDPRGAALLALTTRCAPPATMAAVASVWDEVFALVTAIAASAPAPGTPPPKRGLGFWK